MFILEVRSGIKGRFSVPCCNVKPPVAPYQHQEFRCKLKPRSWRSWLQAYVRSPVPGLGARVRSSQIGSGAVRSYREPRFSSLAGRMTWACPRCTFLNQGKVSVCSICSYDSPQPVVDSGPEWACPSCTYLNSFVESACDMCNTPRPELAELEQKERGENGSRPAGKFRPLRACQRGKADKEQLPEATNSNAEAPITTDLHSFLKPADMNSRKRKAADDEDVPKVSEMEGCTQTKDRNGAGEGDVSNNLLGELHMERMARLNTCRGQRKI